MCVACTRTVHMLPHGYLYGNTAPMSWNGGAGSPEPNGLGDGAHGLLEHVPFPANLVRD
jgi:hypothetical protein